jgi:hypothetical protein
MDRKAEPPPAAGWRAVSEILGMLTGAAVLTTHAVTLIIWVARMLEA